MTTKDDIRLDFSKYTGTYSIKEAEGILAKMKQEVFEAEKEQDLKYIESIHGPDYTYELKKGSKVNLTKLDKNQRICASHIKGYHILMTKK
jgi:hypothetical protein